MEYVSYLFSRKCPALTALGHNIITVTMETEGPQSDPFVAVILYYPPYLSIDPAHTYSPHPKCYT